MSRCTSKFDDGRLHSFPTNPKSTGLPARHDAREEGAGGLVGQGRRDDQGGKQFRLPPTPDYGTEKDGSGRSFCVEYEPNVGVECLTRRNTGFSRQGTPQYMSSCQCRLVATIDLNSEGRQVDPLGAPPSRNLLGKLFETAPTGRHMEYLLGTNSLC